MTTEATGMGEKERKYNSLRELISNTGCLQLLTGTALVLPPLPEENSKKIQNTLQAMGILLCFLLKIGPN